MFLIRIFSFVLSLMIAFVALLLIFGAFRKVSNKVDRWISTDGFFERLDSSVSVDRFLFSRLTGVLIFIGSSYIIIYYLFYSVLNGWPAEASKAFLVIFGLTGIFIGVSLIIRAETIRKINDKLSFSVSTERLFRPLDNIVKIDGWFYRHNILAGILLLLACLLINLRLWLAF
ncbi:MAG: hypothetical protein ISS66_10180 [Desulfobacteraceae bacterium]|nr:hypothetical protein [Desulfobacteraceae bacterium]